MQKRRTEILLPTPWRRLKEAAEYARVGSGTIEKWIKQGLPSYRMARNVVVIRVDDIDSWILARRNGEAKDKEINRIVDELAVELQLQRPV